MQAAQGSAAELRGQALRERGDRGLDVVTDAVYGPVRPEGVDEGLEADARGSRAQPGSSHTKGWGEERKRKSLEDTSGLLETAAMARKAGLPVEIVTGGSTGTYNIDSEMKGLTELQAGSFVFMDTALPAHRRQVRCAVYSDFGNSLTVMTTVISQRHPHQCTIDAGNKALLKPTDEVKGRPDVKVENQGAEYGILVWKDGDREFKLGERVDLYPSNLDMSTNVYDRYYVARGEQIVDVWPIMGRAGRGAAVTPPTSFTTQAGCAISAAGTSGISIATPPGAAFQRSGAGAPSSVADWMRGRCPSQRSCGPASAAGWHTPCRPSP